MLMAYRVLSGWASIQETCNINIIYGSLFYTCKTRHVGLGCLALLVKFFMLIKPLEVAVICQSYRVFVNIKPIMSWHNNFYIEKTQIPSGSSVALQCFMGNEPRAALSQNSNFIRHGPIWPWLNFLDIYL